MIQFIERPTDHLFTHYDVEAFSRPTTAQALLGETNSLLAQLGEHDEAYIYVVDFQGVEHQAVIFMITESEMRNLDGFGDVIWLDQIPLKRNLGRTTWSIAFCDGHKDLDYGGVRFIVFENEESFLWLLQTLEPTIRASRKTVFRDEGSALRSRDRGIPEELST
jgi:hypothetical protein